jgi:hypothetical protein
MRNIGQYAFAVVLASLIFAVFVMWKERRRDVSTNDSSPPAIDLPAWEEDPSVVLPGNGDAESIWGATPSTTVDVPPSTASTETATPSGVDTSSAPGLGVPEFRLARQPKSPAAPSPATPAYPDTGVGPITTGGISNQPDTSGQWGDDSRFVPTRQAIRPPNTDQRSR